MLAVKYICLFQYINSIYMCVYIYICNQLQFISRMVNSENSEVVSGEEDIYSQTVANPLISVLTRGFGHQAHTKWGRKRSVA